MYSICGISREYLYIDDTLIWRLSFPIPPYPYLIKISIFLKKITHELHQFQGLSQYKNQRLPQYVKWNHKKMNTYFHSITETSKGIMYGGQIRPTAGHFMLRGSLSTPVRGRWVNKSPHLKLLLLFIKKTKRYTVKFKTPGFQYSNQREDQRLHSKFYTFFFKEKYSKWQGVITRNQKAGPLFPLQRDFWTRILCSTTAHLIYPEKSCFKANSLWYM